MRVNPLTTEEQTNFEKGKPITTNANRTLKRGMRRNLDRYQLRRKNLIECLKKANIITDSSKLAEDGKHTTHETWRLRARAVTEKIEKEEFARVLLAINKKRGYKSSRKSRNEEEGHAIEGMAVAKKLPASLKDYTVKMNDRMKQKIKTEKVNHHTADPKANASVFLFFANAHFVKTILASRTNGTFGFARHTSRPFAKPKEPFFANARQNRLNTLNKM